MVVDEHINPLMEAVAEATEESIANALVAAETMVGRDGIMAHALDHDRLRAAMREHGRLFD
jgi:D-aminopeptidase